MFLYELGSRTLYFDWLQFSGIVFVFCKESFLMRGEDYLICGYKKDLIWLEVVAFMVVEGTMQSFKEEKQPTDLSLRNPMNQFMA